MSTLFVGEAPAELQEWLARRRALGQDLRDEVWEGVYHVAPHAHSDHGIVELSLAAVLHGLARAKRLVATTAFNLGSRNDFRVPDLGVHAARPGLLYVPTAPLVVEVLSPDDETWDKLPFYAARGVREVLVAHPAERWVRCYDVQADRHRDVPRSEVLGIEMTDLGAQVDWP